MLITENKLRKIIRSVINEVILGVPPTMQDSDFPRHEDQENPGDINNHPYFKSSVQKSKESRQKAFDHYSKYGCSKVPEDSSVEYHWAKICRMHGEEPYASDPNKLDWDL